LVLLQVLLLVLMKMAARYLLVHCGMWLPPCACYMLKSAVGIEALTFSKGLNAHIWMVILALSA